MDEREPYLERGSGERRARERPLLDPVEHYLSYIGPAVDVAEEARRAVALLRAAPERPLVAPEAPRRTGIYALYLPGRRWPVYVGKAGGRRGLEGRLAEHVRVLLLHRNVDPRQVRCRFLPYGRRAPLLALEAALIRYYRPEWNRVAGFGSGPSRKGLPPVGTWEQRYPRKTG